ncbi:MAG: hypothetical protein ACI4XF_06010, partial [Oscillospiraceae bacterium]
ISAAGQAEIQQLIGGAIIFCQKTAAASGAQGRYILQIQPKYGIIISSHKRGRYHGIFGAYQKFRTDPGLYEGILHLRL